ncbi:unique cartilage matrix-associated protein isoform X5 [Fukomys damarensis]|uniref:unique cartilage matrix-associated protein isoform X5 n=1 Tax=Fukomys damarensis TaxID=885580 RepID=UPI001455B7A7|nr:unique cartilage matrix-associated protein isoform X5 [Fukomys damarensis]
MPGRKALLLSCLSALVLLSTLREGTRASVGGRQAAEAREGVQQKIFMQESDASSFLQRRGRRSPKLHGEVNEQEERSWEAVEQWRQWHYDGLFPSYLYDRHHI